MLIVRKQKAMATSDLGSTSGDINDAVISSYRVPKIPSFWRVDPETWFAQVEATFRVANCKTDRTKADYLVSALESEVVKHIRDLITLDPSSRRIV